MFEIQQLPLQICVCGERGEMGEGRGERGEGRGEVERENKKRRGSGLYSRPTPPDRMFSLSPSSPSSLPFSLREDLHVREDYLTYWAAPYSGITGSVRRVSLPPTSWRRRWEEIREEGREMRMKKGGGGREEVKESYQLKK